MLAKTKTAIIRSEKSRGLDLSHPIIWHGRAENFLNRLPEEPIFDLIVTSPPYNIGKAYERKKKTLTSYFTEQKKTIQTLVRRLKPNGSICWQVGNFTENGEIIPLDLEYHKIFRKLKLKLRNRIVWRYGHGLHSKRRFSGRYEVVLWYTKGDDYTFNLDAVRVPSKYPGKKYYKGEKRGQISAHPAGKNPEDVWDIPNVKSNHVEKTIHPCQFPVGLVERLVLALSNPGDLVFDPYAGAASTGVASLYHNRRFVGCETEEAYVEIGIERLNQTLRGEAQFRPHDREVYDHKLSKLSIKPSSLE